MLTTLEVVHLPLVVVQVAVQAALQAAVLSVRLPQVLQIRMDALVLALALEFPQMLAVAMAQQ